MATRVLLSFGLFLLFLGLSPRLDALALGPWVSEPHFVNGQTVQEIRLGALAGDGQLAIAVVTNGTNPGTTSLMVAKIQMLAALHGALPVYLTLVQSSNAFSLGGGCHVGNTILFPYIENFRLHLARVDGDEIDTTTPSIAGTDQYVAAECTNVGDTAYFALLNHTQQRLELYAQDASGFRSENAGFQNVLSVFSGGVRPGIAGGTGGRLGVVYQQTSGSIRQVSIDATTKMIESNCQLLLQFPVPTAFTNPRDLAMLPGLRTHVGDQYRFGVFGDFAGAGNNALTHFTSGGGCASWTEPGGTSAGTGGYSWLASTVIPDTWGKVAFVGNAAHWGRLQMSDGWYDPLAAPPQRAGGPTDGIGVRDNDSDRFGVLVAGVSLTSDAELLLSYNGWPHEDLMPQRRWRFDFEDPGPRTALGDPP